MAPFPRVDIDQPKFEQETYWGRCKHFFKLTNPLNIFASSKELDRVKRIVTDYRAGKDVPDVKTVDELWDAKYLYDSAFHPDTGEKNILIGRMSAQVPCNAVITGGMLVFHKSNPAVIFWQWLNQSFNAIVNYTNRSGPSPISAEDLFKSYCAATGGALATALTFNKLTANMSALAKRLVPLIAVAAANCINIPMMRIQELKHGVVLYDDKNREVGMSKKAARRAITAVLASRVAMASPGMIGTPLLIGHLEKIGFIKKYPSYSKPIQVLFFGSTLLLTTPLGCAFFKQKATVKVESLEKDVQETIHKKNSNLEEVWYNKGL